MELESEEKKSKTSFVIEFEEFSDGKIQGVVTRLSSIGKYNLFSFIISDFLEVGS